MTTVLAIVAALPRGRRLDDDAWEARHRAIRILLVAAAVALLLGSLAKGDGVLHALAEGVPIAFFAAISGGLLRGRAWRSAAGTLGLFTASAMVVHLTEGTTESHFAFFVMVGVIALYQDWLPFLLGIAFVVLEHGVLGVVDPETVYSHQAAFDRPWLWAAIHGAWVLGACASHVVAWGLHERTAATDRLTGLPNRGRLAELLRVGSWTVVTIDLDGFRAVNDRFGHTTGDQVIAAAAGRVRACAAPGEVVGRVAGDEFAVLLPGADEAAGLDLANRAVRMLATPYALGDGELEVPARAGVGSTLVESGLALRATKGSSTRVLPYLEEMHTDAVDRAGLEDDLRRALAAGALALHYQPTVAFHSGQVTGFEALARWEHPTRGWVPPLMFVALAEDRGLIDDLGRWALREATAQIRSWRDRSGLDLVVAVNVSPVQLHQPCFVADVAAALADAGLPGRALVLEITERVFVLDVHATAAIIDDLHELGVRLAIDDFGTGYSSLAYLSRLDVDIVKVDRSFTAELVNGGPEAVITRAIVSMSHELGLEVVAEGVEDEATADALHAIGCDIGQGWHFGHPVPARELAAEVVRRRPAPVH